MSSYQSSNWSVKRCDACGMSGHIAKYCSSTNKSVAVVPVKTFPPKYYANKHNHLPYKNMEKAVKSTNASVIIGQFLNVETNGCDSLMVQIEEVAYSNYNQMACYIDKNECVRELNNLKTMLNYKMEQFIAFDGVSIVSNLIIANSC